MRCARADDEESHRWRARQWCGEFGRRRYSCEFSNSAIFFYPIFALLHDLLGLRSRMMLGIHALQAVERYVRVNLCGRNVGMAKDCLDGAKVRPVLDHVSRAGMPQHVGAGMASTGKRCLADYLPQSLAA